MDALDSSQLFIIVVVQIYIVRVEFYNWPCNLALGTWYLALTRHIKIVALEIRQIDMSIWL